MNSSTSTPRAFENPLSSPQIVKPHFFQDPERGEIVLGSTRKKGAHLYETEKLRKGASRNALASIFVTDPVADFSVTELFEAQDVTSHISIEIPDDRNRRTLEQRDKFADRAG